MATDLNVSTQATLGTQAQNTLSVESVTGLTVNAGPGSTAFSGVRRTKVTLSDLVVTIVNGTEYFGVKLFTFPLGSITVLNAGGSLTFTTTSALASTIASGATITWGLGTATASNVTLSSTMVNIVAITTATSSTTINVVNTATTGVLAVPINLNGTATANPCYFNVAVATGAADGTMDVNGTLWIDWIHGFAI